MNKTIVSLALLLAACGPPQPSKVDVMRANFDADQQRRNAEYNASHSFEAGVAGIAATQGPLYEQLEQTRRDEIAKYGSSAVHGCAAQADAAPVSSYRQTNVYYECLAARGPLHH